MASASITKYCCKRGRIQNYTVCIDPSGGTCSGKSYLVNITSVTSSSNFGIYTNAYLQSRTCVNYTGCFENTGCPDGHAIDIDINSGCFPQSIFPVTVSYEVVENGTTILTDQIIIGGAQTLDCPSGCGDVCALP